LGCAIVVALFHRLDLPREMLVGVHEAAKLDEGAHDGDIDFDGARRAQDAGEHRHALLGEGVRCCSDVP